MPEINGTFWVDLVGTIHNDIEPPAPEAQAGQPFTSFAGTLTNFDLLTSSGEIYDQGHVSLMSEVSATYNYMSWGRKTDGAFIARAIPFPGGGAGGWLDSFPDGTGLDGESSGGSGLLAFRRESDGTYWHRSFSAPFGGFVFTGWEEADLSQLVEEEVAYWINAPYFMGTDGRIRSIQSGGAPIIQHASPASFNITFDQYPVWPKGSALTFWLRAGGDLYIASTTNRTIGSAATIDGTTAVANLAYMGINNIFPSQLNRCYFTADVSNDLFIYSEYAGSASDGPALDVALDPVSGFSVVSYPGDPSLITHITDGLFVRAVLQSDGALYVSRGNLGLFTLIDTNVAFVADYPTETGGVIYYKTDGSLWVLIPDSLAVTIPAGFGAGVGSASYADGPIALPNYTIATAPL